MHEITRRHPSVAQGLKRDEDGFTIIEVLVAAVILLVGILGVATIVNAANGTTTSNKAREQGLALGRELIESARSIRYQSLRPAGIVPALQAMPGFANAGVGGGWTIRRRGIVYTVSVGVCSVDDAGDHTGAHVAGAFCTRPTVQATGDTCAALVGKPASISGTGATGADAADCGLDTNLDGQVDGLVESTASACPAGTSVAAGTCDAQPDDFKRLVTLVTWDRGAGSRFVLQQATVPFPGLSAYGSVTALTLRGGYPLQAAGYQVADKADALIFDGTTSQEANQVDWMLGGVDQGQATWSGTSGWFTWSLGNAAPDSETLPAQGEILDGTYTVGARVQDGGGIHGIERDVTVTLNRRVPFAPSNFGIASTAAGVTASWTAPPDRDVVGYRLWRQPGGGSPVSVNGCDGITARTCTDPNPPGGGVDYWVVALDTDPTSGAVRPGQSSVRRTFNSSNVPPTTPTNVAATVLAGGGVALTWTASTDSDDPVDAYEVWRSGCTASTLVGTALGTATTLTDRLAPSNDRCTYNVRAKDQGGIYSGFSPGLVVNT